MKKLIPLLLLFCLSFLAPPDIVAQFGSTEAYRCPGTDTVAIDTTSIEGAVAFRVVPKTGATSYHVALIYQSALNAVGDTAGYFSSWSTSSVNPTLVFPYPESKVLYWARVTICTTARCCYLPVKAFTSPIRYSNINPTAPTLDPPAYRQPSWISGNGVYKKPVN